MWVVTLWDVGDDHSFMHDEIATDKNHPTVNAGGPVYAVPAGHGQAGDDRSQTRTSTRVLDIPTREAREKVPVEVPRPGPSAPASSGSEHLWANPP